MRARSAAIGLVALLAMAPGAGAATFQVQVQDNSFSPKVVTINPGDTVQWSASGLNSHNVKFDDGSFEQPGNPTMPPWNSSRSFPVAGSFQYHCRMHGGAGGIGMSGTVVVGSGGAPGGGGTGGGGGGGVTPVGGVDRVKPGITALDARQSGRRISVTINTTEAGRATVVVQRDVRSRSSVLRRVARVTKAVRAGTNRITIRRTSRRRRLPFGRYKLTATVKDTAGNGSSKRTDRVRLRARRR